MEQNSVVYYVKHSNLSIVLQPVSISFFAHFLIKIEQKIINLWFAVFIKLFEFVEIAAETIEPQKFSFVAC